MTELLVERDDAVATVIFNRPQAMNALSKAVRQALATAMAELDADPGVRVVILTGTGEQAFTAGLDLKELGSDPEALRDAIGTSRDANPVRAIEGCSKPVIGAINGVAVTGGFEVALACDILLASRTARFADTHARVGIMPGWGLSQKLSRLIGLYRAKELSLSGNFLDAGTAEAWGLVNRVVEPEDLMPIARRLATDIAQVGAAELASMKRLIDDGFGLSFADAMALEHDRSTAFNGSVTAEALEASRSDVLARSRTQ